MTYYIETYGCEMNKAESNALRLEMDKLGYTEVLVAEEANWLIINSCSVRNGAEDRVLGRLGELKTLKTKGKKHCKIALMGCMAQRLKQDTAFLKRYSIDALIGSFDKKTFVQSLQLVETNQGMPTEQDNLFFNNYGHTGNRAYVPIMHGCNAYCSYCIVPYVRGKEISRPADQILNEIKQQIAAGVKEIVLLGQIVNKYNDGTHSFASLITQIKAIEGDVWFRFTSSHPFYFTEDVMQALVGDKRFVPHLHLAAQHGSDKVLKEMNRHYTANNFIQLTQMVKQYWPNVALTTDLMVGFPGETDDDFKQLLSFVETVGFSDAFTYQYSDRSGTIADKRTDKVDEKVKNQRLTTLIHLQRGLSSRRLKDNIGKTYKVLVLHKAKEEGLLYGLTAFNQNVVFKGPNSLIDSFVFVAIQESTGQTMKGNFIEKGEKDNVVYS